MMSATKNNNSIEGKQPPTQHGKGEELNVLAKNGWMNWQLWSSYGGTKPHYTTRCGSTSSSSCKLDSGSELGLYHYLPLAATSIVFFPEPYAPNLEP